MIKVIIYIYNKILKNIKKYNIYVIIKNINIINIIK